MKDFPRLDVLPTAQRELWPQLAQARQCGFVLYGGTAVALRLGHRQSVDYDFFTDREFIPSALERNFPFLRTATILQQELNTLTALVSSQAGQVKVSFFGGLRFGRIEDPSPTPDGVMEVAALRDLLGHKLKVMLQRVEAKDYLDIDAIIAYGHDLADGLAVAKALFQNFPTQESLKALVYYDGGDLNLVPQAVCERLVSAVKSVRSIPLVQITASRLCAAEPEATCDLANERHSPVS